MSDAKMLAKMEMLKRMRKGLTDEMHAPSIGKHLGEKKMMKVVVEAPNAAGLKKGLSKAEQILAAKMGKSPEEMSPINMDSSEMAHEDLENEENECEACHGEGCPVCEDEDDEQGEELAKLG